MSKEINIAIASLNIPTKTLLDELLKEQTLLSHDIEFKKPIIDHDRRSLDPDLIIAVIGAGGVALGALISGIFSVASSLRANQISISSKDGRSISVPAHLPPERIKEYIALMESLEIKKIEIVK